MVFSFFYNHTASAFLKMMDIKMPNSKSLTIESDRQKSVLRRLLPTVFLLSGAFLIFSAFTVSDYKGRFLGSSSVEDAAVQKSTSRICEDQHRPHAAETLPKGIVSATSDLEMRPLWGHHKQDKKKTINLLAMAVGIKQKKSVDKIVKKFVSNDFVVMLFHYDGIVDPWNCEWSQRAIHVSAVNQTKWWFAKRFLHPDIVDEYAYIFLWDEDLGVDKFDVGRYLSIIKEEGLEISQPALEPHSSEVHHSLTKRNSSSRVHRKIGGRKCDQSSTGPPCAGFVEMMAPVFSKASWRCAWHMIQNDLVHGWGLDFQLGYCAQGDRTKNVGIVDSEYIVHYGLPTLGGSAADKGKSLSNQTSDRTEVIKWSYVELEMFNNRWKKAAKDDECWTDQYQ